MHRLLFAVGGTGGHLFPAQALARELKEKESQLEILFGGGKLGSNPFFDKFQFSFREITSSTPFRSNPLKSAFHLSRGVAQSTKLIKEFSPDLIIGFGSFYSFPLLAAARIKKIPYILVESNAFPGKVNRIFAPSAELCAVQFEETSNILRGTTLPAKMPFWSQEYKKAYLEPREARKYFDLDPNGFTLLVFGGSQGASAINQAILKLNLEDPFQVVHLCGKNEDAGALKKEYERRGIASFVKPFEEKMHIAWRAADLVISRAGAGTIAELIEFAVPAILIPWPGASDKHQHKNATVMQRAGGALLLDQDHIDALSDKIEEAKMKRSAMSSCLSAVRDQKRESLSHIILTQLEELP